MANFYIGQKPCPGCGRKASESPRSRADEVCWDCGKLLRLGKGVRENSDGFTRFQLTRYTMRGLFVTDLREDKGYQRRSGIGYVSDSGSGKPDGLYQGSSRHLLETLETLVKTLDEGTKEKYEFKINMEESFPEIYSLRTATALALVEFLDAIRLYGDRREEEGYERGQQLLLRLCDGTLTIDDFNKRSVGERGG